MAVEILYHDAGVCHAQRGALSVIVIREPMTVARMGKLREGSERARAEHGDKRLSIIVLEPASVADVPREVREAGAQMMREFKSPGSALVIEGGGVRGIAARAIVNGMFILSGRRSGVKVFDHVADASRWLSSYARSIGAAPVASDEIAQACADARRAIG